MAILLQSLGILYCFAHEAEICLPFCSVTVACRAPSNAEIKLPNPEGLSLNVLPLVTIVSFSFINFFKFYFCCHNLNFTLVESNGNVCPGQKF